MAWYNSISPFMLVAALVSFALALWGMNAYRKTRDPSMAFVTAAFLVFGLKSAIVGYASDVAAMHHEAFEAIDAVCDMTTVLLLLVPILWPRRPT